MVEQDVAQYGGPHTATSGELAAPTPGEPTAIAGRQDTTARQDTVGPGVTGPRWWQRAWRRVLPPPEAIPDQHHQLNQQLAVLEGARAELEAGWVQGSWWAVNTGGGPDHVDGVCLVGALVRAGAGQNSENAATGRAVDAVYDALWASRGQPAPAQQLVPSPQVRLARVRMLTQWNDRPERTKAEVTTVVDSAISATILALMATPHLESASRSTPHPESANR